MAINTVQEKYLTELSHIHDSEHRFVSAQQEMHARTTDPALKAGLEKHIAQTQSQIKNLHQVYGLLGMEPQRAECGICTGLIKNAQSGLEVQDAALRDCFIGGAATMVEHYEIGVYRGLVNEAELMGQPQVAQLLRQNLQQEEETAQHLESSEPMLLQAAKQQEARA
jgi:ferritin-like metal-binding protein YciE